LFFGRPEFYGAGTQTRDVVHITANRAYLLGLVQRVLALPTVRAAVTHVSLYWVGAAYFCTGGGCTQSDIRGFNFALQDAIVASGSQVHLSPLLLFFL
jgi:hypothetical protein